MQFTKNLSKVANLLLAVAFILTTVYTPVGILAADNLAASTMALGFPIQPTDTTPGTTWVQAGPAHQWYSMPVDQNGNVIGSVYENYLKPKPASAKGRVMLMGASDGDGLEYYPDNGANTIAYISLLNRLTYTVGYGSSGVKDHQEATIWAGDPS